MSKTTQATKTTENTTNDIDQIDMVELSKKYPTKSAQIRALHAMGYNRSQIAKKMNIIYQFVRNVLVNDQLKKGK